MGFSIGNIFSSIGDAVGDFFNPGEDTEDYYKEQQKQVEKSAAANAEVSRYDASVALEAAYNARMAAERERTLRLKQIDKVVGQQMVSFANRGVVSSEGTALDVQLETAGEMALDMEVAYYNGRTAEEQAESVAKKYMILAKNGLRDAAAQSALLGSASDVAVNNAIWGRVSQGIQLYSAISSWGWK